MSKINISYDTVSKELSVKLDGLELDSIRSVNVYKYEDYEGDPHTCISLESRLEDEQNGINYCQIVTANHEYVEKGFASKLANTEGLYEYKPTASRIAEDASKMLKRL